MNFVAGMLAVVFVVLSVIVNGYVITVLWDWFVVSTFALPALSIPQALGLSSVVSYFTKSGFEVTEKDWKKNLSVVILRPVIALAIGWVILQFM